MNLSAPYTKHHENPLSHFDCLVFHLFCEKNSQNTLNNIVWNISYISPCSKSSNIAKCFFSCWSLLLSQQRYCLVNPISKRRHSGFQAIRRTICGILEWTKKWRLVIFDSNSIIQITTFSVTVDPNLSPCRSSWDCYRTADVSLRNWVAISFFSRINKSFFFDESFSYNARIRIIRKTGNA